MQFFIKNPEKNIYNLMRGVGYHFQKEDKPPHLKLFTRRLGIRDYPRFHLYLKTDKSSGNIIFNLHLDQKRPIYKGAPAHGAEYEGEAVEREMERIKKVLSGL